MPRQGDVIRGPRPPIHANCGPGDKQLIREPTVEKAANLEKGSLFKWEVILKVRINFSVFEGPSLAGGWTLTCLQPMNISCSFFFFVLRNNNLLFKYHFCFFSHRTHPLEFKTSKESKLVLTSRLNQECFLESVLSYLKVPANFAFMGNIIKPWTMHMYLFYFWGFWEMEKRFFISHNCIFGFVLIWLWWPCLSRSLCHLQKLILFIWT